MFPTPAVLLEVLSTPFKRSQLGLFHGKTKQFGNNVPFSKKKTRRTWLLNIQNKRLESAVLGRRLEVKVTTRAMRTIAKYGGLDNYVLKTKAAKLGPEGLRIRSLVRTRLEEQEREQILGSIRKDLETVESEYRTAQTREAELEKSDADPELREEALKELWKLEDRVEELKRQLLVEQ